MVWVLGPKPEEPLDVVGEEASYEFQEPESVGALELEPGQAMKPDEFYLAGDNVVVLSEDGNLSIYGSDRERRWNMPKAASPVLSPKLSLAIFDIRASGSNSTKHQIARKVCYAATPRSG